MGLFSAIGSALRSAGRAVGRGIERVGEVIGSETLENIGSSIQYSCREVSKGTGNTQRFNKETARADETQKINKILSDFSLKMESKADEIENTAIKESKVYFNELIRTLKSSHIEKDINIRGIEIDMRNAERNIKGNLKKYISKRVSIDDSECLNILKMDAGQEKEAAMEKFSNSILQKGIKNLISDLKIIINENKIIDEANTKIELCNAAESILG